MGQEHYAKLDALLATAEFGLDPQSLDFTPEALADISKATPEPEDLADISKPKFVNIKSSKARPPRRPGATKTKFKFAPTNANPTNANVETAKQLSKQHTTNVS